MNSYSPKPRGAPNAWLKETVQRALEEILAIDARRRVLRQLQEMDGLDLDKPDFMADAWR